MKVVFFGTDQFGKAVLEAILESPHVVVGVITQPDRNVKRHGFSPVKKLALEKQLDLLQPEKVNQEEVREWVRKRQADVAVVASYGQILGKKLLKIPRLGCFNVHASLLPKLRGASPIAYAILLGETVTGITVQKMVPKLDAGPILLQKTLPIHPEDTAATLAERLRPLAQEAIQEALEQLDRGDYTLTPQKEEEATYAPLLRKEDGAIDWTKEAFYIERQIRAMTPYPGAFTYYLETNPPLRLVIQKARLVPLEEERKAGEIYWTKGKLLVAAKKGGLEILRLTPQARKPIRGIDFVHGWKVQVGHRLGPLQGR